MALQGNFSYIETTTSDIKTVVTTITYPESIPEGFLHYEKRGTTEEVTVPEVTTENIVLENSYIFVKAASIGTVTAFSGTKSQLLDYIARVYSSVEARNNDLEDYLYEFSGTIKWNPETMFNAIEEVYNHIRDTHAEDNLQNI